MAVEEKKERNRKYGAICARAKAMGIMKGDAIGAIMDIDSADQKFNLRLDEFLEADNFNFAHDFIGIQENIVKESFPATDFGYMGKIRELAEKVGKWLDSWLFFGIAEEEDAKTHYIKCEKEFYQDV